MTYEQAIASLKEAPTLRKAMHHYFYMILSESNYAHLEALQNFIKETWNLSDEDFFNQMALASDHWNEHIDKVTDYLMNHPEFKKIIEENKKSDEGIPLDSAVYLAAVTVSYILEHITLDNGKNYLKKKHVEELLALFKDPDHLNPWLKVLLKPIAGCLKGKYTPFSTEYLQPTRMGAELCADYYSAYYIFHDEAMRQLCLDEMEAMKRMDLNEIESFNYGLSDKELFENIGRINMSAGMHHKH